MFKPNPYYFQAVCNFRPWTSFIVNRFLYFWMQVLAIKWRLVESIQNQQNSSAGNSCISSNIVSSVQQFMCLDIEKLHQGYDLKILN